MEVCYWALFFMPLLILQYLYSLQIKGDSQKKNLTHLINHCLRLSHFPAPWKDAKIITLLNPGKDSKFSHNLRPIRLLSTTGKLFEKVILKIVKRHTDEKDLLNAGQFEFRACHSTTLQCIRLTDDMTLNFNNTSWISKKHLIQHGTMAYYISCLKWTFEPAWSSWLALFFEIENFLFRWKAKCLHQG
jgi:hypothetical protein